MGSLNQYLHTAEHLYQSSQGVLLARMLSLSDEHIHNENLWMCDIPTHVAKSSTTALDGIILNHLLCVKSLQSRDFEGATNYEIICLDEVVKLLRQQRGNNWMLPVMFTVCLDLRRVAQKADNFVNAHGVILQKAADSLMACFRVCAEDTTNPEEHSKKVGVLGPVNQLLRIYFKTQQYNMCQSMIRAVEPTVTEASFAMSQLVTFKFFMGRMAVYEGNFQAADQHLGFAFKKCPPQSFKNKRTVLTYLLPVKMLLGYMPVKRLVEKYNLPLFWHLLAAVRGGKIKVLEEIVTRNHRYFEKAGLMTALDNLKIVAYRNVLKKVYLSMKTSRIPITCFQAGLQMMSKKCVDISATQSLIATMIFHQKIKAYMSYSHKTIIFCPNSPFPRLSQPNYMH